jgi:hypothetical protein
VSKKNLAFLRQIDLDDYYNSSAFYGFFYPSGEFSIECVSEIVRLSLQYFSSDFGAFELFSNLVIDEDMEALTKDYELSSQQIEEYFKPLVDVNIFSCVGRDGEFKSNFHYVASPSVNILEKIFHVVMVLGGSSGNVFLLNSIKGIAIYPHDDGGFGVFSLSDMSSVDAAEEFLRFFSGLNIIITKKN